ncbi:hypothetical protein ACLMJK_000066 [Lecanora helva]
MAERRNFFAEQSTVAKATLAGLLVLLAYIYIKILLQRQEQRNSEAILAAQNGCKEPRKLRGRWPFSIDLILQSVKADNRNQILRFFIPFIDNVGNTHAQYLLGTRAINTIDPENLEVILSSHFQDFSLGAREQNFRPLLGHGIFTQNGASWKASRDLLRPIFNHQRTDYFSRIQLSVNNLLARIASDTSQAEPIIDLQPLFFLLTLDVTTAAVLGTSTNSLQDQGNQLGSQFAKAFDQGQHYLAVRGRLGDFYWVLGGNKFKSACTFVHEFVDKIVASELKHKVEEDASGAPEKESYLFIDALLKETTDAKVIRDQLVNVLLAGRDTTACLLSWTFRLLALHPKAQQRLRTECVSLSSYQAGELPTKEELKRMIYLRQVIHEGGGSDGKCPMLVRKGEAVGYCVYAMHRRKDLYGNDADEFRPDRWDENAVDGPDLSKIGWGYLPFNGGPRVCLGQEFAMLEASFAIVRLLQTFSEIELAGEETAYEKLYPQHTVTLVIASANGCKVRLST